jgi:multiple sugar transport system permease protein
MTERKISSQGIAVAAVLGIFYTILAVFTWYLSSSLLSKNNSFPSLLPMIVSGIFIGAFAGYCKNRFLDENRVKLYTVAIGLLIGFIWLLLYSFKPLGGESITAKDILGAMIVFPIAGLFIMNSLKDIPLWSISKGHVELMTIRILKAFGIFMFTLIVVFPFFFMLATSLKPRAEYLMDPSNLSVNLFQHPAKLFNGYTEVLIRFGFLRFIMNSVIVSVLTVIITLIPSILGAYAVTRLHFPGRNLLSRLILLIYMFPAIVLVIPLYSVFTQLGLRDTRHGLLLVYAAMTIPVALYTLRSYFLTLPADLEEAGLIDGLSRLGVIIRITIPLAMPAIAAIGLFVFMIAWNEFLFAYMFLDTPAIFTLARGMVMLDDQEVPRQFLMSGAVIITVPIMVLFVKFQKLLVGGLTAGGVKG